MSTKLHGLSRTVLCTFACRLILLSDAQTGAKVTALVHPVFAVDHRGGFVAGTARSKPKSDNASIVAKTITAAFQTHTQSALDFARQLSKVDPTVQGLPSTFPQGEFARHFKL